MREIDLLLKAAYSLGEILSDRPLQAARRVWSVTPLFIGWLFLTFFRRQPSSAGSLWIGLLTCMTLLWPLSALALLSQAAGNQGTWFLSWAHVLHAASPGGFTVVTVNQHMAALPQWGCRPRQINDCMVISLGKHPRQTPYMIGLGL